MHHWNIFPNTTCCPEAERLAKKEINLGPTSITWTVSDIAGAARPLSEPPLITNFEDEQEMRRVYTLIYDTFRYKGILNQALNDIAFYQFRKREPAVIDIVAKLLEQLRRTVKTPYKLNGELLPKHLKDQSVNCQAQACPVTCWINTNKVKSEEKIISTLEKSLKLKLLDEAKPLEPKCWKWDTLKRALAVFAAPLKKYSSVADPIDLSETTGEGKGKVGILEEQRKTLKFAMLRPQIQVVLYETQ
ncbi:hypothetical protein ILUMI_01347 [Ignelater luminosus]|uniref:Uncharacterized protein n=1 Tax=Ignelater luminosus TaxID=2038154 RepID=A0A8K0GPB4_IGNLU|nr:hypothetical protein ILUMI_01347 [Ignelater luminosus]